MSGYGGSGPGAECHPHGMRARTASCSGAHVATPLGTMCAVTSRDALVSLCFIGEAHAASARPEAGEPSALIRLLESQLDEYFAGTRTTFDIPRRLEGTRFQREVWTALLDIPHGHTSTYGAIARLLGMPAAARAVGAANGRNPISIIVPCHRLVGAQGALTGYGGGMERKAWLLDHERRGASAASGARLGA